MTPEADVWTYDVFGRRLESTLELLRLSGVRVTSESTTPELRVRRARLPATPEAVDASLESVYESPSGTLRAYRTARTIYWFADGVGTVRVSNGEEITVSPDPEASDDAVGRVVVSPGLRSALCQRGAVVVHASAVVVGDRAVAFVGPSGIGKSTAAAACYANGHEVLTDDAMVLEWRDGTPFVQPGAPLLEVDDDVADALRLDGSGLIDVSAQFSDEPRALTAVFVLEDGERFDVRDVEPRHSAFALLRASDTLYGETAVSAIGPHLEDVGALAAAVQRTRLTRPRSLSRLSELPAVVESALDR